MQMTLDGYVSGPAGEMDWIASSDDDWQELFNDMESVDTLLVGRNMHPDYFQYWQSVLTDPAADPHEKKYAELADRTPHILFSRTLTEVSWHNTRIAHDAASEVTKLKQQPGRDMMLWGGATIASELLSLGLVDELRITLNPTLLGAGLPMFNNIKTRHKLTTLSVKPLMAGLVLLKYKVNN